MLILNTTRMSCSKEQSYFLSFLLERKGDEACLCTKTLDKTLLKAVPFFFFFFFRITQFKLSFMDILWKEFYNPQTITNLYDSGMHTAKQWE